MALMNLSGYQSPRYPEGPMTIAAIAQLLSSITGGIGDWQDRKQRDDEFERQMKMRESLQDWEKEKYDESLAFRDRPISVPTSKGVGPTPGGGTVTHYTDIPASDYQMHLPEIERVLGADERAQEQYIEADDRAWKRGMAEDTLAENIRNNRAMEALRGAGGAPGDPMKTLGQLQDIFGGYRKMTETESVGPSEILSELNMMVSASNNSPILEEFMEEAESAPSKSHVTMLAKTVRGSLADAYDQQLVDQIEQFVWEYGEMPVSEGPSVEDMEALRLENDPTYPWRERGRKAIKGLTWDAPFEIDPATGEFISTAGQSEWWPKFQALLSGMGEGY